jgi:hypothetical protein
VSLRSVPVISFSHAASVFAMPRGSGKKCPCFVPKLARHLCWIVFSLLLLLRTIPLAGQGVCPVSPLVQSTSDTLNVPDYRSDRPLVEGDYVVIEYNASPKKPPSENPDPNAGLTSWTDYKRAFSYRGTHIIGANGSFLPVIYTKEKIAVRVCGLHFTDVLTVTTSPNGVPEGGADIRGAAPVTPPATLSSTLDMLQSGTVTGGTTTLPGLGLNAPTLVPSLSLSGITPGSLGPEDQTPGKYPSYTPATVTASGRQVALVLFSLEANAKELSRLIDRTMGQPYPAFKSEEAVNSGEAKKEGSAPGSVNGVAYILDKVLSNVKNDDGDASNNAAFDKDMTDIQNVNAQVSTLASALTSQAFASNAITLLNNFSTLAGVLDLANLARYPKYCQGIPPTLQPGKLSADDLKKIDSTNLGKLTLLQVRDLKPEQLKGKALQDEVRSIQAALKVLKGTNPAGDEPLCSVFEKEKIEDFWNSYNLQVGYVVQEIAADKETAQDNMNCVSKGLTAGLEYPYVADPDPNANDRFAKFAGCRMDELSEKINGLRKRLGDIDTETTELYDRMNEWYFRSSVEQTDLLPPLISNAFVRISIVVQRGYTPFTLANAGGTITPTVTANVPASTTTASTSTPAHAVKTILIEVHRLANFNLMGGVMFIHIPTVSYAVQAAPSPAVMVPPVSTGIAPTYTGTCGGKAVTVPAPTSPLMTGQSLNYGCIIQTQQTDWQLAGMAGLVWFPWGHDYFPRRSGYANFGRNLLPSLLVATSVTSLGNSMGGVNWEPVSGLDFFAGLGSAHRTSLPSGLTVNTAVASGSTLSTVTTEHAGFTLGVGFDLSTIMTLFSSKSTSVASLP